MAIAVLGLVAAVIWAGGETLHVLGRPDRFARTGLPGTVAVDLPADTAAVLYAEGGARPTMTSLIVVVADPTGRPVDVRDLPYTLEYDRDGGLGRGFATFTTSAAGRYVVSVRPAARPPVALSAVAVGPDLALAAWDELRRPIALAATALTLAATIVIGIGLRRRHVGDTRTNGTDAGACVGAEVVAAGLAATPGHDRDGR